MLKLLVLLSIFLISINSFGKVKAKKRKPANITLLDHIPCESKVFDILYEWGSDYQWRNELRFENVRSIKSPLSKTGHWVKLRVEGNSSIISKITPRLSTKIFLNSSNCKANVTTHLNNHSFKNSLSDKKIEKILKDSKTNKTSGVFYIWSPRMNLSVIGLKEAKETSKKLKIEFHLVHDSRAKLNNHKKMDESFIEESKKNASIDLIERGMETHFPSIIFYKNGRLDDNARPGYDDKKRLEALLLKKMRE